VVAGSDKDSCKQQLLDAVRDYESPKYALDCEVSSNEFKTVMLKVGCLCSIGRRSESLQ
jgi:hypothetical protein